MSVSTDAMLFYGYCWDEETSTPWTIGKDDEDETSDSDDEEDWEERYARLKAGLLKPDTGDGYDEKTYGEYLDAKRKIIEACPCEVGTHCHSDAPMPYVCIKATYTCNSRGDMTRLNPAEFEVDESWDSELKKFCKLMGIAPPAEGPGWYMVSYWG